MKRTCHRDPFSHRPSLLRLSQPEPSIPDSKQPPPTHWVRGCLQSSARRLLCHQCEKLLPERVLWQALVNAPTALHLHLRMEWPSELESYGSPKKMIRITLFVKTGLINIHLKSTKIITNKIHYVQHLQEGNTNLDRERLWTPHRPQV